MKRFLLLSFLVSGLTIGRAQTKQSGYTVVVEISYDEQGVPEGARVVQTDDPTSMGILKTIAFDLARQVKQPPRLEDGKPVKFKVRAPFNFPVEDDEGLAANAQPKPLMRSGGLPVYPENLAATGTVGGAILELIIGADGHVTSVRVMRASHPEFGEAAQAAVQQWLFKPAQKDGVPVATRWRIAVDFSMDGKDANWKWRLPPRPELGSFTVIHGLKAPPASAPAPDAPAEKK